jgi:hypothetical protein
LKRLTSFDDVTKAHLLWLPIAYRIAKDQWNGGNQVLLALRDKLKSIVTGLI